MVSVATDVSADGSVVTGYFGSFATREERPFVWRKGTGGFEITQPPAAPTGARGRAVGVSADGAVIAGYAEWTVVEGETRFLRRFPWRWTSPTGAQRISSLGGEITGSAAGISADGAAMLVDYGGAYRWTAPNNVTTWGLPEGYTTDLPRAISDDGQTYVGEVAGPASDYQWKATRWGDTGPHVLAGFPNESTSAATGVSADGSIVIGWSVSGLNPSDPAFVNRAYVWDASHGSRDLQAVLASEWGIDMTGWTLSSATDISADGRVIVGIGNNPAGQQTAWIAYVPEPGGVLSAVIFGAVVLHRRR